MEVAAGAITRRGTFYPGAAVAALRREQPAAGSLRSSRVYMRPRGGFADEGHLRYYASRARCGGREEEKKVVKRREKLLRGLAALQAVAGGVGVAVAPAETEERKVAMKEAADVLIAQLELLRAAEKEMKRKRKEEKKAAAKQMKACDESEDEEEDMKRDDTMEGQDSMTAAPNQMKDCGRCKNSSHKEMKRKKKEEKIAMKAAGKQMKCCEDSSSSSSSESSDSDCEEEVVDMNSLRTIPAHAEPATGQVQMETPKGELDLPITVCKTEEGAKVASALKCDSGYSSSIASVVGSNISACRSTSIAGDVGSNTSACCSSSKSSGPVVMAAETIATPAERIEVCMGGKCKKSGAMDLMQEFERRVGIEGAVVSCKCMGKCKEGPNVRVRNMYDPIKAVRNPLCIGVGLNDVGTIVANFFGEKEDMGLLPA